MRLLAAALILLALPQDPPPQEAPKPAPPDAELVALAARCGRDVQWRKANDLEGALLEASKSGRLVFAYVYDRAQSSMFGNKFKDKFMMAGAFADPDLVAFLNRRFIPARFDMNTEFADEVGLKLSQVVVPAILFLAPDSKVVHKYDRITSASTELLYKTCRTVLEKNPTFNKPGPELLAREKASAEKPADDRARYLFGLELLREGEWDRALAQFAEVAKRAPKSREAVESLYRSAWIHRLRRKADDASAAIDAAVRANADAGVKIAGDLLLERALVHLGQGRIAEARKLLEQIAKDHPKGTRTPEASYFLGAALWMEDLEDEAKKTWTEAAKGVPANPWARKCAAEALEDGPFVNGWESYDWMAADQLSADPRGTERPRKPEEYPQVVERAVEYMIREQRKDGSWRNVQGQFEFRNCITVIAHMSLVPWPDVGGARNEEARQRARKFIDKWVDARPTAEGMIIWDHMFSLIHYSRLSAETSDAAAKKECVKRARRSVRALEEVQRTAGTWSYVGMGPSSFTTGGVLYALWEAKQAGIKVDQEVIDRGLEGMSKMKSDEGTFFYSDQSSDEFDDGNVKGAAGRMAVCYLAEYLWGKCDLAKLKWALDAFIENRGRLNKARKGVDWHTLPHAIASYFFFYDYWFASMAMLKLPEADRGRYLTAVRNDLLEINEVDGTWVDTHLFGKPYGTAMALMILKNTGKP
jgi:tetratricopeptide (TPR) repeat protein